MQFTVLIEFLVPGLATTLLTLALLPDGVVPKLPQGLASGETVSALILLAVSYPVGILTNFPVFKLVQRPVVTAGARKWIFRRYAGIGTDLSVIVSKQYGLDSSWFKLDREGLRTLFGFMRSFVFTKNIDRLNDNHLYHEGLQRLARGMLLPLTLASIVVWRHNTPGRGYLITFCVTLFVSACALMVHSVKTEDEQIVRFFLATRDSGDEKGIPNDVVMTTGA
jgi:hypothetical protein